jgi:predicted secreted hydrolase
MAGPRSSASLRAALALLLVAATPAPTAGPALRPSYPEVRPGASFRFPADHGAHPAFRTEWWYLTGWLSDDRGRPLGFQITFFRTRPEVDQRNPSRFAAKQILFAHAALSDPQAGRLMHDSRVARAGFGLAEAATTDMNVRLADWRLARRADGTMVARAGGKDFVLDLAFRPTQPILLQGQGGYSRKGPAPAQASYYYSMPHLAVTGTVRRAGRATRVSGRAWLDREWSSTLLDPRAVGWDWAGINLDDGGALTAFRVRGAGGGTLWAGGSLRDASGRLTVFASDDVRFATLRRWRSPRTAAVYPVEAVVAVRLNGGERRFRIEPLFDDQELDSRPAGPVYWEGAVRTDGGRGYLELTGYTKPLKM